MPTTDFSGTFQQPDLNAVANYMHPDPLLGMATRKILHRNK